MDGGAAPSTVRALKERDDPVGGGLTFLEFEHTSDFSASVALLRSPHGKKRLLLEGLTPENNILQHSFASMANQSKFT